MVKIKKDQLADSKIKFTSSELNQKIHAMKIDMNKTMSFNQYRIQETISDVEKMQDGLKPRWYENIPFFGCFAYIFRIALRNSNITRGPLRRQIVKFQIIFMLCLLPIFSAAMILTPWVLYAIHTLAIKKTKELIVNHAL